MKEEKKPFENMKFSGVEFKVINRQEAHEIIGNLTDFKDQKIYNVFEDTWRFPDYEDNAIFLLAEGDVEMDSFEMDYSTEEHSDVFILGFIFKGNLVVNKVISSFDTDNSPALIVLGKTTTINITLFGSVHYLGGGVQCDALFGEYNHGELFVKGESSAWLIYSDDMSMHFESFNNVQAVISANRPDVTICSRLSTGDGETIMIESYFPSTHKLSDIVNDLYIEQSTDYDRETLTSDYYEKVFKEGLSLIDHDKEDRYLYTNFRTEFAVMIQTLLDNEVTIKDGSLYVEDGITKYSFVKFLHEEEHYCQIAATIGNGFDIRMRALWSVETKEITLLLEYLDEEENTKYQWINNETAVGIEYYAVKHAVTEAFEILNKESLDEYDESEPEEDDEFSLDEFLVQFKASQAPDDLLKLFEFQSQFGGESFSESFYLYAFNSKTGLKTWSENEEFYNSFIEFATANGSGSSYAYWLIDNDLNNCPIVVFGDEGGIHVVAENTQDFIRLLTYDTEISVDHENIYFYKDEEEYEESENKEEFVNWTKENFGLHAVETEEETELIIKNAKEKFGKKLNSFLEKFDIETFEEVYEPKVKAESDKYNFQKIEGEKIEFKDFNFKLAVIQILMYEKELLLPKFDLYEFVELYDKREIDIEEEGYDFIPEVTEYFKKLEIDQKFAQEITEIIQDGGDDIYLELYRFWDGEDDAFNIKSAEDFKNFKNITKVELFYDEDDSLINELKKMGIETDYI
jgi:hypothetical protein